MITFGTVKKNLGASWKNVPHEVIEGYYLVLPNGDRHWLGRTFIEANKNLDKACEKYLKVETNFEYWIDFCMGYDVERKLAWANLDQTDNFI